jgi:hypothetical protein
MPRRRVENTYLVEHYRPGLTAEELGHCVTGIQDALRALEGEDAARFLGFVAVPADEAFLVLLGAESERQVDTTYQCIGTTFDRISLAFVELGPSGRRTRSRPDSPTAGKGTTR